ncbi:MAG: DUF6288 domain-containing protein [Kiritimatiellia bacterium]|jgi:hypothetical protein|nr:DUF6288 domain-containing protein [Kiritimatiellia bacterium]
MRKKSLVGLSNVAILAAIVLFASNIAHAQEVPDLLKGEGPDISKLDNSGGADVTWTLHYHDLRGWMYKDKNGKSDLAKQILISAHNKDSRLGDQCVTGDVILGVNGKMFEKLAVFAWRTAAGKAREDEKPLEVIMWRKGWDAPRNVTLTPEEVELGFLKGYKPTLKEGVDWNLGATGARGWLHAKFADFYHARQIYITKVHEGSPADGVLQEGDVILGIDNKPFSSDARKAFGKALTQAETREAGGRLRLLRWRAGPSTKLGAGKAETVTIQLDVLGSYSKTTPWDCEKSQKILDRACAYLVKNGIRNDGITGGPAIVRSLALMATGNKNYMPVVKEHIDQLLKAITPKLSDRMDLPRWHFHSWGMAICACF